MLRKEATMLTGFENRLLSSLQFHTISKHQRDRLERFLSYERLPSPKDTIGAIVLLGTAKQMSDFATRIDLAVRYAAEFSEAKIIVSGRGNAYNFFRRRTEAQDMEQELVTRGVESGRIIKESKATNTKENIDYSLQMLPSNIQSVLAIGSGYVSRRIQGYIRKFQEVHDRKDLQYFIADADVEDEKDKTKASRQNSRRTFFLHYEWPRLIRYRRKGDL